MMAILSIACRVRSRLWYCVALVSLLWMQAQAFSSTASASHLVRLDTFQPGQIQKLKYSLSHTRPGTTFASSTALSTTPLFHMGHSHAHHHHHHTSASAKQLSKTERQRSWRRRIALWGFCILLSCIPKVFWNSQKSTFSWTRSDLMFTALCVVGTASAEKLQRSFAAYIQKVRGVGDAIVKHSYFGNAKRDKRTLFSSATNPSIAPSSKECISQEADKVTWIGVGINILLSVGKLIIGLREHSSVLVADAGHSLSDLVSDFITLWSVQIARLPPDEDHPYGHTKFEAIGSLFLSLILLATGLSVGTLAYEHLLPYWNANAAAAAVAASGNAVLKVPGPMALAMAGISIASKEWLFQITRKVGEKLQSPVVLANAWHHRSDAYSSILALLSIAWSMAGFRAADAAAGLLVAAMIGMTGADILVESIQQLSDSADLGLQESLQTVVEDWVETDPDVLRITTLRARQVGSSAFCDVTVETWPDLTTTATRAVEERLKKQILQRMEEKVPFITATVHAKAPLHVPSEEAAQQQEEMENGASQATSTKPSSSSLPAVNSEKIQNMKIGALDIVDSSKHTSEGISTNSGEETTPKDAVEQQLQDDPLSLSATQVEGRVRQQASLMEPPMTLARVQSVAVHYLSPQSVNVDVTLEHHPHFNGSQSSSSLSGVRATARNLQSALVSELEEIHSARIYLDLLGEEEEHELEMELEQEQETKA